MNEDSFNQARRARAAWRTPIVLVGLMFGAALAAPEECIIRDPELQGHYEGPCVNGYAEGYGSARGAAAQYVGSFKEGYKNGRGVKTWANGDRYEGEFINDRKDGQGLYVWGAESAWSGDRYRGEFKADQREGQGTYEFANGDRYQGRWKADVQADGRTSMQSLRVQAEQASLGAMSESGTIVCPALAAPEVLRRAVIRGKVIGVKRTQLAIELLERGPAGAQLPAKFSDYVLNWEPCQATSSR